MEQGPVPVGSLKWLVDTARRIESGELELPGAKEAEAAGLNLSGSITRDHIDELWKHMVMTYGHKWVSNYGEADHDDTWLLGLQGKQPSELGWGVLASQQKYLEWPPTLPQFRALCAAPLPKIVYDRTPLPKRTPAEREAGLKHLANIREILRGAQPGVSREPGEDDDREG